MGLSVGPSLLVVVVVQPISVPAGDDRTLAFGTKASSDQFKGPGYGIPSSTLGDGQSAMSWLPADLEKEKVICRQPPL
jgi:hypothetical protein